MHKIMIILSLIINSVLLIVKLTGSPSRNQAVASLVDRSISIFGVLGAYFLIQHLRYLALTRKRIFEQGQLETTQVEEDFEDRGFLGSWLALAGYRSRSSARTFISLTVGMLVAGGIAVFLLQKSWLFATGLRALENFPGAIGQIFLPILYLAPWIIVAILVALPTLLVRASRRRIVTEVERDLPLVLELMATLGESGLGFDAAIARIIDSQPPNRPLTSELRTFQRETLTGRPRVESLRRLARRLDVQSLTIFISAVVQAEQVGAGVADVLRRQADDVRDRRRDRALNLAQALPVKLLFPLIICFLPAILVFTMGPILLEFIKFADAFMSKGSPP